MGDTKIHWIAGIFAGTVKISTQGNNLSLCKRESQRIHLFDFEQYFLISGWVLCCLFWLELLCCLEIFEFIIQISKQHNNPINNGLVFQTQNWGRFHYFLDKSINRIYKSKKRFIHPFQPHLWLRPLMVVYNDMIWSRSDRLLVFNI